MGLVFSHRPCWTFRKANAGRYESELRDRLGLRVSDAAVPALWRPYYRGMLARGLADLQRVLPALDFRGLRVRFGRAPAGSTVLALHDPQHRTVFLPPATGAGTIAHEFAHDLDYQVAERRYGIRGDYATDFAHAHRARPAGRLRHGAERRHAGGARARRPGRARPRPPPGRGLRPQHGVVRRLAVSLAREGRTDGYLTSVQDDMLTGGPSSRPM